MMKLSNWSRCAVIAACVWSLVVGLPVAGASAAPREPAPPPDSRAALDGVLERIWTRWTYERASNSDRLDLERAVGSQNLTAQLVNRLLRAPAPGYENDMTAEQAESYSRAILDSLARIQEGHPDLHVSSSRDQELNDANWADLTLRYRGFQSDARHGVLQFTNRHFSHRTIGPVPLERLYVRFDPEHVYQMLTYLIDNVMGNPELAPGVAGIRVVSAERAAEAARSVTIYGTRSAIDAIAADLASVQKVAPEYFQEGVPSYTQPVGVGLGRTQEPLLTSPGPFGGRDSSATRTEAIVAALAREPSSLEEFTRFVDQELAARFIDPNAPHRNLTDPGSVLLGVLAGNAMVTGDFLAEQIPTFVQQTLDGEPTKPGLERLFQDEVRYDLAEVGIEAADWAAFVRLLTEAGVAPDDIREVGRGTAATGARVQQLLDRGGPQDPEGEGEPSQAPLGGGRVVGPELPPRPDLDEVRDRLFPGGDPGEAPVEPPWQDPPGDFARDTGLEEILRAGRPAPPLPWPQVWGEQVAGDFVPDPELQGLLGPNGAGPRFTFPFPRVPQEQVPAPGAAAGSPVDRGLDEQLGDGVVPGAPVSPGDLTGGIAAQPREQPPAFLAAGQPHGQQGGPHATAVDQERLDEQRAALFTYVARWRELLADQGIQTPQDGQVLNQAEERGWLAEAFHLTAEQAAQVMRVPATDSMGTRLVGAERVGPGRVGRGRVGPALPGTAGYAACVARGACGDRIVGPKLVGPLLVGPRPAAAAPAGGGTAAMPTVTAPAPQQAPQRRTSAAAPARQTPTQPQRVQHPTSPAPAVQQAPAHQPQPTWQQQLSNAGRVVAPAAARFLGGTAANVGRVGKFLLNGLMSP